MKYAPKHSMIELYAFWVENKPDVIEMDEDTATWYIEELAKMTDGVSEQQQKALVKDGLTFHGVPIRVIRKDNRNPDLSQSWEAEIRDTFSSMGCKNPGCLCVKDCMDNVFQNIKDVQEAVRTTVKNALATQRHTIAQKVETKKKVITDEMERELGEDYPHYEHGYNQALEDVKTIVLNQNTEER